MPLEEAAYIEFNRIRHKTAFRNSNSTVPETVKATPAYKGFADGFLRREVATEMPNQKEFTGVKAREYNFFYCLGKRFYLKKLFLEL